jgi:hypothetical protein
MKPIVVDDIIDTGLQNRIWLDSKDRNWLYSRSTYRENTGHTITSQIYDVGQLVSPIIAHDVRDPYFENTLQPLMAGIQQHIKPIVGIHRAKFNLLWKCLDANGRWGWPHLDTHDVVNRYLTKWSIVYYANDADGDTVFFMPYETIRVAPKRGRAVIFPANIKHAGTNPTVSTERVVLNIVVDVEPMEIQNEV